MPDTNALKEPGLVAEDFATCDEIANGRGPT